MQKLQVESFYKVLLARKRVACVAFFLLLLLPATTAAANNNVEERKNRINNCLACSTVKWARRKAEGVGEGERGRTWAKCGFIKCLMWLALSSSATHISFGKAGSHRTSSTAASSPYSTSSSAPSAFSPCSCSLFCSCQKMNISLTTNLFIMKMQRAEISNLPSGRGS